MMTLSFILGRHEEVEIGETYYFGQLYDGSGNMELELLESGSVCIESVDEEIIVDFKTIKLDEKIPMCSLVEVTDIRC